MQYNNTLITATKFGKLITIIINNNIEINKVYIRRKKIKLGIVYFSIK